MKEIFGILAIILGLSAGFPYVLSVLRGKTKPHRVSWAIWALIGAVTLTSYIGVGARWSILLAVAALFNNAVIFILSLRFGTGGTTAIDKIGLFLGVIGVILWLITHEASYALLFAIAADAVGTALSVQKAYKYPFSESGLSWSIAATASVCGLLAVHSYTFMQTVYPAYAVLGGSSLAFTTLLRRK